MILPEPLQQVDRTWVEWRGQTLAYFAGCDYFRMSSHPQVLYAAHHALQCFGLNVAASRRTTGNHVLYDELESALSDFFGSEASVLVSNGYLTNLAVIQAVADQFSRILIDERSHSSLADAAAASGLATQPYQHKSVDDLRKKITNRTLVMTDGVFAHDGSVAPLDEIFCCLPTEACLLVDDSHGAGVLGANGTGTHEYFKLSRERLIQTTTLSKAFGCFGGVINTSREIGDLIYARSNAFAGSTPFPLPCAAAALEVVRLLDDSSFRERLRQNCTRVGAGPGSIFSVTPKDDSAQERFRRALLKRGIFPPHIRYQNGPSQGYFRFAVSSEHTRAQLDALAEALTEAG